MKSRARKEGESAAEFLRRIERQGKSALRGVGGNLDKFAEVYGIDVQFAYDRIQAYGPLKKLYMELKAEEYKNGEVEVDLEERPSIPEAGGRSDRRLKRSNWPTDEGERNAQIFECMKVSLVENEGDLVDVAECLNRSVDEMMDFVDNSEELSYYRDRGLRVKALRAENQLYKNLDSGNHQAVKMALNNLDPERWSDRSTINVNNSGFGPQEKTLGPDIVSIVKGAKGA